MQRKIIIALMVLPLLFSAPGCSRAAEPVALEPETTTFESGDGLTVTAELYMTNKKDAPYILLFHQADYSRGEYNGIAPLLNKMGFNCLAVDQRSGSNARGVVNETAKQAKKLKMKTQYADALPDLEAALEYAENELKAEKIIVWGSSYSASLVFVLAEKHPEAVDGLLAFSPGEYMKVEGRTIEDFARKVTCPVFITSASDETEWKTMYDKIPSENKACYIPDFPGKHGSSALWESYDKSSSYWEPVKKFLETLK